MGDNVDSVIGRAIEAAGGTAALAQRLGIQAPSIYSWRRVPAERVLAVEAATKISRHDLRPDLYPRAKRKPKRSPVAQPEPPAAA
jgi:DNA-binding transcriptional regulator YdaS (Cro superfamily)